MALNWNLEKVKDLELVQKEHGITDALIWATMGVGMGQITEKNCYEFYARVHYIEKLRGTFTQAAGAPYWITLNDVKNRIGLETNASRFSRHEMVKRQNKRFFEELVS